MSSPKSLDGMGFKDFVLFNQAMLGKQCWRILTEPTSFCARVLKGQYFLDSDFLSAGKPRASSFTCRSILFGRDLLMKGLKWGVGNDTSIKIMHDNWVPGFEPGTFNTLEPIPANATVKILLDQEGKAWDMDVVRFYFTEEMASGIQQIPVSRHGGEDFASWPYAKFGVYTVRSAYNMARTEFLLGKMQSEPRGKF